jgi:hypothetical protein
VANQDYPGFFGPPQGDHVNNAQFMIDQESARVSVMQLVKVLAVYAGNDANVPTTVDVQPMIDMTDPNGKRTPHGTIYGVPAARRHGGRNAVLIDPVVGDVGMMHVCDRDASSVFANGGAQSAPGSSRRHDLSDGFYQGSLYTLSPNNKTDYRTGSIAHSTPNNVTHSVGRDIQSSAGGSRTLTASQSISHTASQGNITHTAGQGNISHTASQGDISHTASQGNITHTAHQAITLMTPFGSIGLSSTGISMATPVGTVSIGAGGLSLSTAAGSMSVSPTGAISMMAPGGMSLNLPTSAGASGTVWNNGGVVTVVP